MNNENSDSYTAGVTNKKNLSEKDLDDLLVAAGRGGKQLVHKFLAEVGERIVVTTPEEAVEEFLDFLNNMRTE